VSGAQNGGPLTERDSEVNKDLTLKDKAMTKDLSLRSDSSCFGHYNRSCLLTY